MKYLLAVFAFLIVVTIYVGADSLWHNQYDDSYITYRYAVNLAEGHGLVFNEGERADAASSFLYTVILASFYRAGVHNLEWVSFVLNMVSVGLITAFVFLCGIKLGVNRITAATVALIASVHGFISGWSVLGMDTVLFAALLAMWAYWTFIKKREILSTVFTILIVLMRFEGILVLPVWFMAMGKNTRLSIMVFGLAVVYYGARYYYYYTFLPHSFHAKSLLSYYHSQPWNIIATWARFALVAPLIAFAGALKDCHVRWLGLYILISATSCLAGPNSDWCRYTVHLFPLMLIAGLPMLKNRYVAVIVCAILLWQGYGSVQWMRYQAANLAPCQAIRGGMGDWLQKNVEKGQWIISSDVGEIAYKAKDCKFLDLNGLTSADVLDAKREGRGIDSILQTKQPMYLSNTCNIENGQLIYKQFESVKSDIFKHTNIKLIHAKQYTQNIAIIIAEIHYK